MELYVVNTMEGLKPYGDDDYEAKRKLRIGQTYKAVVTVPRNMALHRKYFKLVSVAWELLDERARQFFGSKDGFRKTVEMAAGHCERIWSIKRGEWVEIPRSVSPSSLGGAEFADLYERVRNVILDGRMTGISEERLVDALINF